MGESASYGVCYDVCREIAKELRVNLLGYDYSGYGASQGEASVLNALADIEACYQWLTSVKGKQPNDIVLYGKHPMPPAGAAGISGSSLSCHAQAIPVPSSSTPFCKVQKASENRACSSLLLPHMASISTSP